GKIPGHALICQGLPVSRDTRPSQGSGKVGGTYAWPRRPSRVNRAANATFSTEPEMPRILRERRPPALERGAECLLRDPIGQHDGVVEHGPAFIVEPGAPEKLASVPIGENFRLGRL